MIKVKNSQLNKKEEKLLLGMLSKLPDDYQDFYITKNDMRLFIKENFEVVAKGLQKGDYIIYDTEESGILFVLGYSDKFKRKYIKLLTKDAITADKLIAMMLLNIEEDLYIKINKRNPLIKTLKYWNFEFKAGRGKEVLMIRRHKLCSLQSKQK